MWEIRSIAHNWSYVATVRFMVTQYAGSHFHYRRVYWTLTQKSSLQKISPRKKWGPQIPTKWVSLGLAKTKNSDACNHCIKYKFNVNHVYRRWLYQPDLFLNIHLQKIVVTESNNTQSKDLRAINRFSIEITDTTAIYTLFTKYKPANSLKLTFTCTWLNMKRLSKATSQYITHQLNSTLARQNIRNKTSTKTGESTALQLKWNRYNGSHFIGISKEWIKIWRCFRFSCNLLSSLVFVEGS